MVVVVCGTRVAVCGGVRMGQNSRGGEEGGEVCFFFFQAEDGIRDRFVTGVQTCALPISIGTTCAGGSTSVSRNLRS